MRTNQPGDPLDESKWMNEKHAEQQRLDALLEHRKQFRASLSPSQSEIAREIIAGLESNPKLILEGTECQCATPRQQARNSRWICAVCGRPIIEIP